MRLFTYMAGDQARPARQVGPLGIDINRAVDLYYQANSHKEKFLNHPPASVLDWLNRGDDGLETVLRATNWMLAARSEDKSQDQSAVFAIDKATFLAPIPNPGKVICAAGNFPSSESIEKPSFPTLFLKPSSGVIGSGSLVVIPALAKNVAYELELAVVIGRRARNIPVERALSFAAGYTIANDLGDRVIEKRTSQWTSGKMFDTFTPLGPTLVTPDEITSPDNLEMITRLNGSVVQKGSTAEMFFHAAELLSMISELTTLVPGDVILCGSPKMMGGKANPTAAVKPGDVVEVSIENLGTLCNPTITEEMGFS